MIEKLANLTTNFITKVSDLSTKDKAYLNYGLQLILGVIVEAVIMLSIAYMLNIFWPVFIAALSFLVIRPYAGGIHLPSYLSCMIVTIFVFLLIGLITQVVQFNTILLLLVILLVSIFGLFMINKYAPADTDIIPITDPKQRSLLKQQAQNILLIWTAIAVIATFVQKIPSDLILASSLGIFAQLISTHPIMFYLVKNFLPEHR